MEIIHGEYQPVGSALPGSVRLSALPGAPSRHSYSPQERYVGARRIVYIIDDSPSMATPMVDAPSRKRAAQSAVTAALEFLCAHSPHTLVGLVAFAARARALHPLVPVGPFVSGLKASMEESIGSFATAFAPALEEACDMLQLEPVPRAESTFRSINPLRLFCSGLFYRPEDLPDPISFPRPTGRDIVLLLTDGEICWGHQPAPWLTHLKRNGVEVQTVGVGNSPDEVNTEYLERLASWDYETARPMYQFIHDSQGLSDAFVQISGRLVVDA